MGLNWLSWATRVALLGWPLDLAAASSKPAGIEMTATSIISTLLQQGRRYRCGLADHAILNQNPIEDNHARFAFGVLSCAAPIPGCYLRNYGIKKLK